MSSLLAHQQNCFLIEHYEDDVSVCSCMCLSLSVCLSVRIVSTRKPPKTFVGPTQGGYLYIVPPQLTKFEMRYKRLKLPKEICMDSAPVGFNKIYSLIKDLCMWLELLKIWVLIEHTSLYFIVF